MYVYIYIYILGYSLDCYYYLMFVCFILFLKKIYYLSSITSSVFRVK